MSELPHPVNSPLDRAKVHEVVWQQVSDLFGVARSFADSSFVYVIGERPEGPLKIGVAKDPVSRLRSMQTGNSRPLRIEYVLLGNMRLEKLLHELWEPFAITSVANAKKVDAPPGTEWFRAEVRGELFPILTTAAADQIDLVVEDFANTTFAALEAVVRRAHIKHNFVAKGRDEVRLLAAGGMGYHTPRPSRI